MPAADDHERALGHDIVADTADNVASSIATLKLLYLWNLLQENKLKMLEMMKENIILFRPLKIFMEICLRRVCEKMEKL